MPNKFIYIFLAFLLIFPIRLLASGVSLTYIGGLNTQSKTYGQWWYSSANPILKGTADPSSTITIGINSLEYTTTADATGNWSYQPTTLDQGEHNVQIKSGDFIYGFVLHIGSTLPDNLSTTATAPETSSQTLPVAGNFELSLLFLVLASALIFSGISLAKRRA